jgi:hypothetical protein
MLHMSLIPMFQYKSVVDKEFISTGDVLHAVGNDNTVTTHGKVVPVR